MYSIYTNYKVRDLHDFMKSGKVANATYLGEVNNRPDIYEKVSFNGKTYVVSMINDSKKLSFAQEIKILEKGTEFEFEREVVCPYCGSEQSDSWELDGSDGEENETYCGTCGEDFVYIRNIEITYSSYPK
ncbi:hypothetical protein M3210_02915 [Oceanobacillus luteolus]|uniref:hypothetical protein n=1 Tax=Oceanobacillus luteolus TaxID=1274358 RepID=UPI00203E242E|nr:hypothetical protein [Oceanobacillus luteolus]MCM3739214.1 hypothetical protein [Oceanobacillus luteolus]